ncbi:MAG: NYN domain-containing protein [Chloroflexota bacterium]|nr:NYN domain-containing protein [Caldilineaceae bacterium]MDE2815968.1 NYN domain-containing protein [Chloroflexota bacterium]
MNKVIAYVDGFNLYFGLRDRGWRKYYWLDLEELLRRLLKSHQELEGIHYFTSRIQHHRNNKASMDRQAIYLHALNTLDSVSLHFGHYLQKPRHCLNCGATWMSHEEKMTDVNIATQLLADAYEDRFDTALLMSADSDLTTPVRLVLDRFRNKRIVVVQPPRRRSVELGSAATACFTVGEANLRRSQFPDPLTTKDGLILRRPEHWK